MDWLHVIQPVYTSGIYSGIPLNDNVGTTIGVVAFAYDGELSTQSNTFTITVIDETII